MNLERSREELAAARHLLDGGYPAQAASRAYFGAFYAAEAALSTLGETRSKHSGVLAAFNRLVVKEGGCPEEVGRLLRALFETRNEADYGGGPMPAPEAERALQDARRVIDEVTGWLQRR